MKITCHRLARRRGTAVAIMARNRRFLTRLFLSSLKKSRLDDAMIVLVDDASEEKTAALLRDFYVDGAPMVKIVVSQSEHRHLGIHDILRLAWDLAANDHGCRYLAVLDSDTVVRPDWLVRMRDVHQRQRSDKPLLVSGYNSKSHLTLMKEDGFCHKASMGGASLLFSARLYHKVVRDALEPNWDWRLVEAMHSSAGDMLALSPSAIQHVGCLGGSHGSLFSIVDCSFDYPAWWTPSFMLLYYLPHLRQRLARWLGRDRAPSA